MAVLFRFRHTLQSTAAALALLVASASTSNAQPSDKQVIKDLTSAKTIGITLTKNGGTRQWNSDTKAFEWVRGAVCTLRTEHPDVKLLVVGDAVYNLIGTKATYRKFRVASNEYLGLPKPSVDTLMAIITASPHGFFGQSTWMQMVGNLERLEVLEGDGAAWTWHTFNSVELPVAARYSVIVSYTDIERVDAVYHVRFYRDDINSPWKPTFVSTMRDRTVLGRSSFTADQIRAMETINSMEVVAEGK